MVRVCGVCVCGEFVHVWRVCVCGVCVCVVSVCVVVGVCVCGGWRVYVVVGLCVWWLACVCGGSCVCCQHMAPNSPCFQHTPCLAQLLHVSSVLPYPLDHSSIAYAVAQGDAENSIAS